ncbi:pilus assembly protein PilM [Stieleria varia]|uniref:Competence protein A n=1 Tax=Stieleria varia TaxID=2528005 RepID=A0A5C5ZYX3_9BACT|nr:pilus assembly protein PilM [Stieleria varia]TWT92802.1 Competence protein A [Stieleria varia]
MASAHSLSGQTINCGACEAPNLSDAQFCQGCGHALHEQCPGCSKPTLLGQAFCGTCGHDLKKTVETNREKYETWMGEAIAVAKQHDFDRAQSLLKRVSTVTDYRYADLAKKAKIAAEKVQQLASREVSQASEVIQRAKEANARKDHVTVIELLSKVPTNLLDLESKSILEKATTLRDQLGSYERDAQAAIAKKDWALAGPLLDQLLQLEPDQQDYQRLARAVTKKLLSRCKKYLDAHRYDDAVSVLDSVPSIGQDDAFEKMRLSVDNLRWMAHQFEVEPYATPVLGRLAVRWTKDAPDDPSAKRWVQRLATDLKQKKREPKNPFPTLLPVVDSWCGGPLGYLGVPTCVSGLDAPEMKAAAGRMNVALGLALQGLGQGRIKEQFAPKKGFLSSLRKKPKKCWGIDIGASGVRAVCLAVGETGITFTDCFIDEFDAPLCRRGSEAQHSEVIGQCITKMLESKDLADAAIWVNLPSRQLVSRFVRLPPLADKMVGPHLDNEIEARIPIPLDELIAVKWVAELEKESQHGRPATIVAARKHAVEQRIELLKGLGLDVSGMQGDAMALVNFAVCEFPELLNPTKDEKEKPKKKSKSDESEPESESIAEMETTTASTKTPTIAFIDCGAEKTSVVLVSAETQWSWSIENGSEDLTSLLAKSNKVTHDDAEKLKRNPAAIQSPASQYAAVENRLAETRSRLELVFNDAQNQNDRFEIVQTWCLGGGALTHQFLRRVLLSN